MLNVLEKEILSDQPFIFNWFNVFGIEVDFGKVIYLKGFLINGPYIGPHKLILSI